MTPREIRDRPEPGIVRRLGPGVKVPHMGWSQVRSLAAHPALPDPKGGWLYFVHSYAASVTGLTLASCTHGEPFAAIVASDRVMGAQFHPERSSAAGARFLKAFLDS